MKVTFLCTNDRLGGAAIVTYRLMEALVEAGVDARMVVAHKSSASDRVSTVRALRYKGAFLAERGEIFLRSGFNRRDLWKVDTARYGCGITSHPWVRGADTVVLSWVNQGLVSLADIRRLHAMGKRILWIMHDMWCATGICHHPEECRRFESRCHGCQFLRGGNAHDLSTAIQLSKGALYSQVPITFIAVSHWLAEQCRRSSLMRGAHIEVIPNAFPVGQFAPAPTSTRSSLGLPDEGPLIVFAAARIDDPIKNLPLAVATLNALHDKNPHMNATAIFCGAMKDPMALNGLHMPYVATGPVTEPGKMAQIFAHATAVLSTSVRETLPGTLIEGMAAGATPVTTGHGGQADIIDNGTDGYICPTGNPDDLAALLYRALTTPLDRNAQHAAVTRRFAAPSVVARLLTLLDEG